MATSGRRERGSVGGKKRCLGRSRPSTERNLPRTVTDADLARADNDGFGKAPENRFSGMPSKINIQRFLDDFRPKIDQKILDDTAQNRSRHFWKILQNVFDDERKRDRRAFSIRWREAFPMSLRPRNTNS